jgi:NAD(P)-dependent dehydrogenase (short-subunit alcohol dehydrogenase family)
MVDMAGKAGLITGGAGGIGREAARLLAKRGARAVIGDIDEGGGEETVRLIRSSGGSALFVHCDVASEDNARTLVERCLAEFGRLDFALNNAGFDGDVGPLADQDSEVCRRVLDVNLMGVFLGMKHQLPVMVRQGSGAIVNTSSIAGVRGHPGLSPYVAAKHGVNGLTKTAALEYAQFGVRVNCVCPGGVRTAMLDAYLESAPELKARIVDAHPMQRMGEAAEMAAAAVWLCSAEASYVNGHELVVDGGKIVSTL